MSSAFYLVFFLVAGITNTSYAQTPKIDSLKAQLEYLIQQPKTFQTDTTRIYTLIAVEKSLYDLYSQTHHWEKAYNHHIAYSNLKDTIFGEEKTKELGRVEMKHEIEITELRKQQEEKEKNRQSAVALSRRNTLQYSLIFFVIAILLFVVLYSKRLMAMLPEKIFFININKATAGLSLIFIFIYVSFETLHLIADPYINSFTGGAPAYLMLINIVFACLVFPVHSFLEKLLANKTGIVGKNSAGHITVVAGFFVMIVFNSFIPAENLENITQQLNNETIKQSPIADSLLILLKKPTLPDTQKVNLLNELSLEYRFTDRVKAKEYLNKAMELSVKNKYKKGMVKFYTLYGNFASDTNNYTAALTYFNKALEIDSLMGNPYGLSKHYNNIGTVYCNQSDYLTALRYYLMAIETDSILGVKSNNSAYLINIGIVYSELSDYPKALKYFFKALELDSILVKNKNAASILGNIGGVYYEQADYPRALKFLFKALEIDSVLGNIRGTARHLGNIGNIYYERADYSKALPYFCKSFEMDSIMGNQSGMANCLSNMGNVCAGQADYNKALRYYFRALEIDSVIGNKNGMATKLGYIGSTYSDLSDYPKALHYLFKALEINKVLEDKRNISANLGNIGSLYTDVKQYMKAEFYLKMALELSDSVGTLDLSLFLKKSISDLFAVKHQWEKAFHHHVAYRNLKDTLFGEEKTKELGRVEIRHEMEMAEIIRQQQEKEAALVQVTAVARRNKLQYFVIIIGFFLLLGVILALSRFKMSSRFIEFISFVPFLILFEFILVLLDPQLDVFTAGAPVMRLFFNIIVAGCLFPLQRWSERRLKGVFFRTRMTRI